MLGSTITKLRCLKSFVIFINFIFNITAFFFLTYLVSNFSQTHFVERVMSFVLGNTNTPFPPCLLCREFTLLSGQWNLCK